MKIRKLSAAVATTLIAPGFIPQVTAEQLPLEEVIVTAQKRTESVQDIPSTVNVVSGSAIKDFNVFNFQDLQALTAGLEIDSLTRVAAARYPCAGSLTIPIPRPKRQ
jgi:outer membrane cobalamin receptor